MKKNIVTQITIARQREASALAMHELSHNRVEVGNYLSHL